MAGKTQGGDSVECDAPTQPLRHNKQAQPPPLDFTCFIRGTKFQFDSAADSSFFGDVNRNCDVDS